MTPIDREAFAHRFPAIAAAVGDQDLEALLEILDVRTLCAGEILIAEGSSADALFLVWEGQLDVSIKTPGGAVSAGPVEAGSFLGEVSLLDPGPATATVTAEQGCVALSMSRPRFDELCAGQPALASVFAAEINRTLAARLTRGVAVLSETVSTHDPSVAPGPPTEELVRVHTALHVDAAR